MFCRYKICVLRLHFPVIVDCSARYRKCSFVSSRSLLRMRDATKSTHQSRLRHTYNAVALREATFNKKRGKRKKDIILRFNYIYSSIIFIFLLLFTELHYLNLKYKFFNDFFSKPTLILDKRKKKMFYA